MKDDSINLRLGKDIEFKASLNYDNETYSISTKDPVEALPITNIVKTIASTQVPLIANTVNKFLAIKNNGSQAIELRLATVNITSLDNKDLFLKLELKDKANVTGTFTSYAESTISEYSVNPTFTSDGIPVYPNVDLNNFGTTILNSERLNLFTKDVIARIPPNKVLCFSALSKNATSFNFFIRHIEEF